MAGSAPVCLGIQRNASSLSGRNALNVHRVPVDSRIETGSAQKNEPEHPFFYSITISSDLFHPVILIPPDSVSINYRMGETIRSGFIALIHPITGQADTPLSYKKGSGNIKGFKPLFEDFPELDPDLRIKGTDRTDIIIGKILEFCPCLYAAMRLSAFFIVDIPAYGTDIPGGVPFLKSPLPNPALALITADGAYVIFGKVVKSCPGRDIIMRLPPERRVHVPA